MGISRFAFEQAATTILANNITGTVVELGKQDASFGLDGMIAILHRLKRIGTPVIANGAIQVQEQWLQQIMLELKQSGTLLSRKNNNAVSDVALFRSLGFSDVKSLDVSAYEGADLIFDMNVDIAPSLPPGFAGADLVFDGGTMEHVFHVPNYLANIHKLLKVGGYVMHQSPSNNYVDHGFYQFSPTFFADYYLENKYRLVEIKFVRHTRNVEGEPWMFLNYQPGDLDGISFGGLGRDLHMVFACAQKTEASTFGRAPSQGLYRRLAGWK